MIKLDRTDAPAAAEHATIYLAFELSKAKWKLGVLLPGSQLIDLKSIGPVGGQKLVNEVFYRDFDNPRQVGSYFGRTGTPYNSSERSREQGISKAGNRR